MTVPDPPVDEAAVWDEQLDEVVAATRLFGALIAESLASARPAITAAQWRVLVLAAEGRCNVSAVAEDLGVHMSNATRTCDKLVEAGLLTRRRADQDRRQVLLALTPAGRDLVDRAMSFRRRRLRAAMAQLSHQERTDLARSLTRLAEAAAAVKSATVTGS